MRFCIANPGRNRRSGHPDTLPRWQYRSVPGASSDGNAEYLARMEERQRHDLMCYLRGDVHGFPNRFRAGTLRFTTDGLRWRPMWSIHRKWKHLPPLDRVIEFRPWGIPGDPVGGKFRYKRKVVTASGPLGTIQFALRGVGGELVRRFIQPDAPRGSSKSDI